MLNSNTKRRMLFLVFILSLAFFVSGTQAQDYVYVSAEVGDDANPSCTRTAPCRQIIRALDVVGENGIVVVLSSGDYAGFIILRSMQVVAESGIAAIITSQITIYSSSATVSIRGLTALEGFSVQKPVKFLTVEDCVLSALSIISSGNYSFKNTTIRQMAPDTFQNIVTSEDAGVARVIFDNCSFQDSSTGLNVYAKTKVTINNSTASNNGTGFVVMGGTLFIENCRITNNTNNGVLIEPGNNHVHISNTTIADNGGWGVYFTNGYLRSYGNNRITRNGSGYSNVPITVLEPR